MDKVNFSRKGNGCGFYNVNGKSFYTPLFFPTLSFNKSAFRRIDDICLDLISHISSVRLINYLDIEKNQLNRKNNILTFVDSGGFKMAEEGGKVDFEKNSISLNDREISYKEVLSIQNKYGEIGNSFDIPYSNFSEKDSKIKKFNLKMAKASLQHKPKSLFLLGTIHGNNKKDYKDYTNSILELPFDGYAVGGLVKYSNSPDKVLEIISAIREIIPGEKPLHVFGVGRMDLIPRLILQGVDSFDSSSYIRKSLEREYIYHYGKENIQIENSILSEKTPCNCPICRNRRFELFTQNTIKSRAFLSLHNLSQIKELIDYCRILRVQEKLKGFLENSSFYI